MCKVPPLDGLNVTQSRAVERTTSRITHRGLTLPLYMFYYMAKIIIVIFRLYEIMKEVHSTQTLFCIFFSCILRRYIHGQKCCFFWYTIFPPYQPKKANMLSLDPLDWIKEGGVDHLFSIFCHILRLCLTDWKAKLKSCDWTVVWVCACVCEWIFNGTGPDDCVLVIYFVREVGLAMFLNRSLLSK